MLPKQTSYTHTHGHTDLLHTHTVTQTSYTHTHTHTHTHTQSHTAIINLKFCSQRIIAGQMPSFIQVTFPPLGLKDSLHKVPELLTYLVVLKAKKLLHL